VTDVGRRYPPNSLERPGSTSAADKGPRVLASVGLAVGGVFSMAGAFAPSAFLRGIAGGIDGVVLVATFAGWIWTLATVDALPSPER
jgi:hypothetical protein